MSTTKLISLAAAAAALALSTTGSFAGAAVTTTQVKLLDGPTTTAPIVVTVAPGAKLGVLWCGMQGTWCLVSYHARQGFVGATEIKLIGGQLAVGSEDIAGNGSNGNGPGVSGPGGPHLVLHPISGGIGSLGGNNGGGGSQPGKAMATTVRPLSGH